MFCLLLRQTSLSLTAIQLLSLLYAMTSVIVPPSADASHPLGQSFGHSSSETSTSHPHSSGTLAPHPPGTGGSATHLHHDPPRGIHHDEVKSHRPPKAIVFQRPGAHSPYTGGSLAGLDSHGAGGSALPAFPEEPAAAAGGGSHFGTGGDKEPGNSSLTAEMLKQISEFDLAAYYKDDFTKAMEMNVMRRCFAAFDVLETGTLAQDELLQLCQYLGETPPSDRSDSDLWRQLFHPADKKVDFDTFWQWWENYSRSSQSARSQFAVVSGDFSVPFHEQQLLTEEQGEKYTLGYRVFFKLQDCETGKITDISPWHDIPLVVKSIVRTLAPSTISNCFNMICEIPKWTRAKFEISTTEALNPIKQDMKNGVPRFYKHGDMMFNYGAFPQTWESTEVQFVADTYGDNDPLDAIDIGMSQMKTGQVTGVKVLGILGMIDDGQMDWKVICIAREDPIARFMDDIDDVPKVLPGCLDALREWLRVYKICQGGHENKFAFNGDYQNRTFALKVIAEAHRMWNKLHKVRGTRHFASTAGSAPAADGGATVPASA